MNDFVEPSMIYAPEEEPFEEPSFLSEDSHKLPSYAEDIDPIQALRIGTGRGLNRAYRGVKDLILAGGELLGNDYSKNARQQMREEGKENDKYWNDGIANKLSPVSGYAKTGQFIGEVAPGLALPASRAATLLGRAGVNAGIGGAYELGTTEGSAGERGLAGATGAIGAGLGSAGMEALLKPVKGYMGDWGVKGSAKAINEKLTGMGLSPRVGDLDKSATLMNMAENLHSHLPTGAGAFAREKKKLRDLIVPDDLEGTNIVTRAITHPKGGVDKHLQEFSDEIYAPVRQKIGSASVLIDPKNMRTEAKVLKKQYPKLFKDDYFSESEAKAFKKFTNSPGPLTYDEFRNIQQILGAAQGRAQNLVNKGDIKSSAVGMAKNAYEASKKDFSSWGQSSSTSTKKKYADIIAEHDLATERWKKEVLPWKESDIADELRMVKNFGDYKTARTLTNPDVKKVDQVRKYLKEFGPKDGSDVADAVATMNRHGTALGTVDEGLTHSGSLTAAGLQEALAAVVAPTAMLSGTRFGKNAYFGDAVPLMTSPLGRLGLSSTRESGPEAAGIIALLKELTGSVDEDDKGMGVQTQDSFRNPGRFNQQ